MDGSKVFFKNSLQGRIPGNGRTATELLLVWRRLLLSCCFQPRGRGLLKRCRNVREGAAVHPVRSECTGRSPMARTGMMARVPCCWLSIAPGRCWKTKCSPQLRRWAPCARSSCVAPSPSLASRTCGFLGGRDTPSQDVLQSLANWHHGAALEDVVRVVRLTRPYLILTWLPGFFIGENHGDHQAFALIRSHKMIRQHTTNPFLFIEVSLPFYC
jgi:hypothetical protein